MFQALGGLAVGHQGKTRHGPTRKALTPHFERHVIRGKVQIQLQAGMDGGNSRK